MTKDTLPHVPQLGEANFQKILDHAIENELTSETSVDPSAEKISNLAKNVIEELPEACDLSQEEMGLIVNFCVSLIRIASYQNWSVNQMKDFAKQQIGLTEEMNATLQNYQLPESLQKILLQTWTSRRDEIHATKINHSYFSNSASSYLISKSSSSSSSESKTSGSSSFIDSLRWRVDQLTNVKDISESSNTVAVVELPVQKNNRMIFEVDKQGLENIVNQFEEVIKRIEELSI